MESAEVATGGGMQRQGGISAPGWRLLQAIAGVHLKSAQTGSPGIQPSRLRDTGVHWYFRSCSDTVVPSSSIRSCPPLSVLDLNSMYLFLPTFPSTLPPSISGGWVGAQADSKNDRAGVTDPPPQASQGWNTSSTSRCILSDSHSVSQHQSQCQRRRRSTEHRQAETNAKGTGLSCRLSHNHNTIYSASAHLASPWQYCNPHARYPSCNGPASKGSQAAPPTTFSCGAEHTVLISQHGTVALYWDSNKVHGAPMPYDRLRITPES